MSTLETLTEHAVLDAATETALAVAMRAGCQEARNELWRCNQRLIVSVAKHFMGRGMSLEDLVSEGQEGLARALDKFDPGRGLKLSTYAVYWIRQALRRALDNDGLIRLPVHRGEAIDQLRRAEADYASFNGAWPADDEIAEALGWPLAKVATVRAARRTATPESLERPFRSTLNHDGDPLSFADIVPTPADAYAQVDDADAHDWLSGLLSATLDNRERLVLSLRYGLCGEPQDYATIGRRLGITRERVRQIAEEALTKLRRLEAVKVELESRRAA